jgi:hypothetical protein
MHGYFNAHLHVQYVLLFPSSVACIASEAFHTLSWSTPGPSGVNILKFRLKYNWSPSVPSKVSIAVAGLTT